MHNTQHRRRECCQRAVLCDMNADRCSGSTDSLHVFSLLSDNPASAMVDHPPGSGALVAGAVVVVGAGVLMDEKFGFAVVL